MFFLDDVVSVQGEEASFRAEGDRDRQGQRSRGGHWERSGYITSSKESKYHPADRGVSYAVGNVPGHGTCHRVYIFASFLLFITSAEGGYVFCSVCLSVCPSDNWKSCERILTKFRRVGHGPETNEFNFGDDLDHRPDPGIRSPKSGFTGFSGLSKKLPSDFDEILWKAEVWPRDQLITFWWRSASLSGSGSPFRIKIRIREELAFGGGLCSLSTSSLHFDDKTRSDQIRHLFLNATVNGQSPNHSTNHSKTNWQSGLRTLKLLRITVYKVHELVV